MKKGRIGFSKLSELEKDAVNVVVFGPGFGESIVLYVPDLGWGVIDSCTYKKKNVTINPALEFLKSRHVSSLAFVILTHPHRDHFQGLSLIIDHFLGQIQRICYYSGEGIREYRLFLTKKHLLNEPGLIELAGIFKKFEQAKKAGAHILKISERTEILRRARYGNNEVEMIALSPSAESIAKYVQRLHRAIPRKDGDFTGEVEDSDHNLLSAAIFCRVGDACLIFGSDLEVGENENMGWRGVMLNPDSPDLATQFVKVPHHGSKNAFHEPVWRVFSRCTSPVSVITPYERMFNPLPRPEVVEEISKFSDTIAVTAKTKTVKPEKIYSEQIVRNLHGVNVWKYIVKPDQIGCVRVSLSPTDGALSCVDIVRPAYLWN
jgi:beta-lactamase superfamily II metal-dependent hydrolase